MAATFSSPPNSLNETLPQDCMLLLTSQEVAWTTVLHSLIAFALNTMLQPAGTVCGGPPTLGLMLRSSPIICLIDTVFLIVRLIYYWTSERNFRRAHARLIRLRYQPWVPRAQDDHPDAYDDILAVQRNQGARLLAFILTSPLMVRMYGFQGLYWSKVIASMYLGSFVVVEALIVMHRPARHHVDPKREEPIKSSGLSSLSYISVTLAVAFTVFFGASAFMDIFEEPHSTLIKYLGLFSGGAWLLPFLFALGFCAVDTTANEFWRDVLLPIPLLILGLGLSALYYAFGPKILEAVERPLDTQAASAAFCLVWAITILPYANSVFAGIRRRGTNVAQGDRAAQADRLRRFIEKSLAWYFMLCHLVTAVLYLCFSYDSTGTYAPTWTNPLD